MRVASPRPLYALLWLLLPWISYMLTLQALRPHWSQTNHLELPPSWCSKTTSQNMCWHTWPLIKLQKPLPNFYMEVTSLSFRPQPGSWVIEVLALTSSIIKEMCKILGIKWLWTMPYHPQTNGMVERSHQMIMHMIGKLGEDKKANWPSHLAEIVHAYNATQSAITGYSPHYLMFGWWPRLLVDFVFPTIGSNEAPTRKASAKCMDEYVASIWDRLQTTLWETQAQSMVEACWQKRYYDRKIGAVNLKPGDLVLVKADAFKGKRKIKDRWEEDTWEVVIQITTDVPSYKVMNQHGRLWVLHWEWLLLVMSEVGIPLCMGNCHTWDRCTCPTPHKTTSVGGEMKWMLQENDGKVVTQWPISKASLGWKNGKLWLLPWTSTGASTEDGWRPQVMWCGWDPGRNMYIRQKEQHQCPLTLADSEPHNECNHSQNWVTVCKAKQKQGGVKQVINPHVKRNDNACLSLWYGILPPTRRETLAACRGWLYILHRNDKKWTSIRKPELTARAWGCAPTETGGSWKNP